MKILKLKVKNFAPILVAMKRRELSIDFTVSRNILTMIVGGNGSGKTSIGSLLHPFAFNGNIDSRKRDLIIENENGYKEIMMRDNDDIYNFRHFYTRNSENKLSVKSFMMKNGVELNENGNSTSFKELIETHLGIDESFLKLTRLGSNVINIINMDSSERKEFMNKRLEVLNSYNEFFKKVSLDFRTIKNLLKINIQKTNQLNISDIDNFQSRHKSNINRELLLTDNTSQLNDEIVRFETKMEILKNENRNGRKNPLVDYNEIRRKKEKLNYFFTSITTLAYKCDDFSTLFTQLESLNENNYNHSNIVNNTKNKIFTIESIIENSVVNKHIDNLIRQKEELESNIDNAIKELGNENPNIATEDLKQALIRLQYIMDLNHNISFSDNSLIKIIMNKSKGKLDDYLYGLQYKAAEINNDIEKVSKLNGILKSNVDTLYIMVEPKCGIEKCSYRRFYNDVFKYNKLENVNEDIEKISKYVDITNSIIYLRDTYKSIEKYLKCIPDNPYTFNNIINNIINSKPMMNFDYLYELIKIGDGWDELEKNKLLYKDIIENIERLKDDKLDEYKEELRGLKEDLISQERELEEIKELLNKKQEEVNQYIKMQEKIKERDEIDRQLEELEKEVEEYNKKISEYNEYKNIKDEKSSILKIHLKELEELKKLNKENDMKIRLYEDLKKERDILEKDYNDYENVLSVITPRQGIPLEFMNFYLENIKILTNEFLNIVYDGNLYIDSMEATDKTFDIIYVKDGMVAGDISSASQGESSFITIALSFAFLIHDNKNYNIFLLDELDGTLDFNYKQMFLDILYTALNKVDCEQCFIISHNELYNDQDLDIITTSSNYDTNRFVKGNILFSN